MLRSRIFSKGWSRESDILPPTPQPCCQVLTSNLTPCFEQHLEIQLIVLGLDKRVGI